MSLRTLIVPFLVCLGLAACESAETANVGGRGGEDTQVTVGATTVVSTTTQAGAQTTTQTTTQSTGTQTSGTQTTTSGSTGTGMVDPETLPPGGYIFFRTYGNFRYGSAAFFTSVMEAPGATYAYDDRIVPPQADEIVFYDPAAPPPPQHDYLLVDAGQVVATAGNEVWPYTPVPDRPGLYDWFSDADSGPFPGGKVSFDIVGSAAMLPGAQFPDAVEVPKMTMAIPGDGTYPTGDFEVTWDAPADTVLTMITLGVDGAGVFTSPCLVRPVNDGSIVLPAACAPKADWQFFVVGMDANRHQTVNFNGLKLVLVAIDQVEVALAPPVLPTP